MPKILFSQFQNIEFFVEGGEPMGGAAVETLVWMETFKQFDFNIQQIKSEDDNRKVKKESNWIEMIPVYNEKKRKVRMWYTYRLPLYFKALKKAKCDYLYTSIPKWYFFYINIFCKILGIKHIIRIPSDEMVDDKIFLTESKINYIYIKLAYLTADLILAQNDYQLEQLKKSFPNKKVLKFYNPIIIDKKFLTQKTEFKGYVAWVANFRHVKNMALLYNIAENLPKEKFKVAGVPILPLDEETEASIEKLKLLENVEFVGRIDRNNILKFLSKAKYLLNTSRYEGFSNTFIEAMCTGTPILTTNNANPDNIIKRFELGRVYKNELDLQKYFEFSIKDTYLEWSKNSILYVQENHDHRKIGLELINYLNKL